MEKKISFIEKNNLKGEEMLTMIRYDVLAS